MRKLPKHSVIRRKGLGSDYDNLRIHGVPVPFSYFMKYHNPHSTSWSRKTFDIGCALNGDNRKLFRELFGKCSFTYRGGHFFHCWYVQISGTGLLLFTAKDHGTNYEVVDGSDKLSPSVEKFLDVLALVLWSMKKREKK